MSAGGQPGCRLYTSMILYHNNSPRWNETIRLAVPIDSFTGSHLRLEFSHCSSSEYPRIWADWYLSLGIFLFRQFSRFPSE